MDERLSAGRSSSLIRLASGSSVLLSAFVALGAGKPGVQVTDVGGKVRVEIGGELFTEYCYKDVPRPFLYPIIGLPGVPMTRNWPMKEAEGEDRDHQHHRSLWWAHGDVNGHDFWSESDKAGRIVHQGITGLGSGPESGYLRTRNHLVARDGSVVGTEDVAIQFYNGKSDRVIDFDVTLTASHGELVFGDTKEGTMAIRIAESMRLVRDKKPGLGHIVNSEGVRDGQTWGKRAKWCDYYGPVDGRIVGVAILDHPDNPRHPTWWHVRDYGLFAANPFGVRDFEKKPAGTGKLTVPDKQSITFRYRFVFHSGDEKEGRIAEHYAQFTKSKPVSR